MTKVQIKSEKLTSFGGIFPIMEKFDRMLDTTASNDKGNVSDYKVENNILYAKMVRRMD